MLHFAIWSVLLMHYAHAQGPMFKIDPKWSPPPKSDRTILFGDIALTPEQERAYLNGTIGYNAVIGQHLRWKDAIIPYKIDCSIENLPDAVDALHKAMAQWERKTCMRFVKWTNQKFHLTFFRNTHCWGNVGQVSYSKISVGPGCEFEHVMAHEIGHVVGLYHEQNRKDRDQWVKVLWENIGQFRDAFDIVQNTDALGIDYDYESIMHYPWNAFSSNGKDTMKPIKDVHGKVPYIEISKDDIRLVSRMYNCPAIEKKRHGGRRRVRIPNTFDRRKCIDRDTNCESWAKTDCGLAVVKRLCKRSCADQSCFGGDCIDLHKECPLWKKWGHCKFVDSVQMDCQKSCNPQCKGKPTGKPHTLKPPHTHKPHTHKTQKPHTGPTTKPIPTQEPTHGNQTWPNRDYLGTGLKCIDKYQRCASWAKQGECEHNEWWMTRNCRKSCPKSRCDRQLILPPGSCNQPLGLSAGVDGRYKIPDSAMTGTPGLSPGGGWHADAENARLYFEDDYDNHRIGAFCAGRGSKGEPHIDVDLQEVKTINYIATQGRDKYFERVSEFKIQYSEDGVTYKTYQQNGKDRKFYGNCDHVTPVLNRFKGGIKARHVRYIATYWNYPCVRMEFYGC